MFTNLTYQDKEAFFQLMDEYFASRPQFAAPATAAHVETHTHTETRSPNVPTVPSGAQLQALGRFLSPPQSAASTGPKTDAEMLKEAKDREKEAQRMDMVSKYAQKSINASAKSASRGIGMVSRSDKAMGALDKYGAGGLVRGADGFMNKKTPTSPGAESEGGAKSPPPAPSAKKGGVSGLVSGKSFGHVDTGSKMSAFTSMWKDPKAAQPPTTNTYTPPVMPSSRANLPPPRRTGSASTPPVAAAPEPEVEEAEGQAQALYDYSGADAGDLSIQTGQIVNVLEKTSSDWWTCEDGNGTRGLVPANYLKEI